MRNDKDPKIRKWYGDLVARHLPSSPIVMDCARAFLVGGLICVFGQLLSNLGKIWFSLDDVHAAGFTSIILVFLGALFTGLGLYDRLGLWAGAGSAVPITGFANSVVAPAMEFRQEGLVMGVGARIFSIAGPVLVHGLLTGMVMALLNLLWGNIAW